MAVPERPALIHRERSWTYRELYAAVSTTVLTLDRDHGVRDGARVVIRMENSAEYVVLYLAVLRAGGIAVPINPRLTPREAAFIVGDADPVLFVCDAGQEDYARTTLGSAGCAARAVPAGLV